MRSALVFALLAGALTTSPALAQERTIEVTTSANAVVEVPAVSGLLFVQGSAEDGAAGEALVSQIAEGTGVDVETVQVIGLNIFMMQGRSQAEADEAGVSVSAGVSGAPENLIAAQSGFIEAGWEILYTTWQPDPDDTRPQREAMQRAEATARDLADLAASSQGCSIEGLSALHLRHPMGGQPVPSAMGELFGVHRLTRSPEAEADEEGPPSPISTISATVEATYTATCRSE